jgi:hypothetical protein
VQIITISLLSSKVICQIIFQSYQKCNKIKFTLFEKQYCKNYLVSFSGHNFCTQQEVIFCVLKKYAGKLIGLPLKEQA